MNLRTVAEAMNGWIAPETEPGRVVRTVIDSRDSGKDCLFFALKGTHTDGHDYVDDVIAAGGTAVVSRGERKAGIILVKDVQQALQDAAGWRRRELGSTIIAISGSSGKTTTRLLLTAALGTSYTVYSTEGNLNNQLGLPVTLLNTPEPAPEIVVLEMGMNHPGELTLLGEISSPDHCLITNIGLAHLEFFSSRDEIAEAKAELIRTTGHGGICVIPTGERILESAARERGLDIRCIGVGGDAWVEPDNSSYIVGPWKVMLNLKFRGMHNAMNAASAMLMADALDVQMDDAAQAMGEVNPVSGRGRIVKTGNITILDESYNANPDSVTACLSVLETIQGDRGAVLGDMRELGGTAAELHRDILRKADALGLRFLILTGEVFNSVKSTIVDTEVHSADDWEEALDLLRRVVIPGTTVLVKGSNSVRLSELVRIMEEDN